MTGGSLYNWAKPGAVHIDFNPLYIGGIFHCYMLDESDCHFRGVGSILSLLFYFNGKSC